MHVRDIGQAHEATTRDLDLRGAERQRAGSTPEHADGLLATGELGPAAGCVLIQRAQGVVHVDGRHAERFHASRIEIDANLPVDATRAGHAGHAAHAEQALGDVVVDEPGQGFR